MRHNYFYLFTMKLQMWHFLLKNIFYFSFQNNLHLFLIVTSTFILFLSSTSHFAFLLEVTNEKMKWEVEKYREMQVETRRSEKKRKGESSKWEVEAWKIKVQSETLKQEVETRCPKWDVEVRGKKTKWRNEISFILL